MITQDQLKDVLDRADALYKYLKIDEKKMEYEEEDLRTQPRAEGASRQAARRHRDVARRVQL